MRQFQALAETIAFTVKNSRKITRHNLANEITLKGFTFSFKLKTENFDEKTISAAHQGTDGERGKEEKQNKNKGTQ